MTPWVAFNTRFTRFRRMGSSASNHVLKADPRRWSTTFAPDLMDLRMRGRSLKNPTVVWPMGMRITSGFIFFSVFPNRRYMSHTDLNLENLTFPKSCTWVLIFVSKWIKLYRSFNAEFKMICVATAGPMCGGGTLPRIMTFGLVMR